MRNILTASLWRNHKTGMMCKVISHANMSGGKAVTKVVIYQNTKDASIWVHRWNDWHDDFVHLGTESIPTQLCLNL